MAIKPEDKPKVIGLIAGLVGVLAYVLIALVPKLMAGNQSNQHADAPPPALTAASATSITTAQAPAGDASAAVPDDDNLGVPPPPRDSFAPPPSVAKAPNAPPPALGQKPGAPAVATAEPGGGLMPIGMPVGPGGPPTPGTPAPAKPPLPPIELKGVILGDPAIAVISINGEVVQRQVGDTIFGDLKLAKIADVGITVVEANKYTKITVGKMMDGSGPPAQTASLTAAPQKLQ